MTRNLFNQTPPPLDRWPDELLVLFTERANIREFDGGMNTEAAREAAMREVWENR